MRKIIFFISIVFLFCGFTDRPQPVMSTIRFDRLDDPNKKLEPENRPRTPMPTFEGYYDGSTLYLLYEDSDCLQVEVLADSSFEIFNEIVLGSQAREGIYIGQLSDFNVTCTLSNGETYYGEYHVNNQ
ncbi:MAG: hypothetical protein E7082_07920 [Bacteroidales bacterium]|nr:hypothetical protein [Bacteroidales bacterium]